VAVAAAGQWGGITAAEAAAAACAAVGIGVAIGLVAARDNKRPTSRGVGSGALLSQAGSSSQATPRGTADAVAHEPPANCPRAADLRGARLTNTVLVRADLRQADLRGAILRGADLTGADLTGAQLGPLDDLSQSDEGSEPS
jgi:hypothetical protein